MVTALRKYLANLLWDTSFGAWLGALGSDINRRRTKRMWEELGYPEISIPD